MFQFCSLFSGSSGNSLLVRTENTNILIDAGESAKKITEALSSCGIAMENIDAIVVSHEHIDHVKSVGTLSKKYAIPVYANTQTWDAMATQAEKIAEPQRQFFKNNASFSIGDLVLYPFSTPHDAANSCGFTLQRGNKKISIATDLGHIPRTYSSFIRGK